MIVVKGTGRAVVRPDLMVLTMDLQTEDMLYERAMDSAAGQSAKLHAAVQLLGIDKSWMKTDGFTVTPRYTNRRREDNGEMERVFCGYAAEHRLKLELDLDTRRLGEILGAVSGCGCDPALGIAFTVRDREAVCARLLEEAAKDARQKAQVLARASGVSLGKLVSVEYGRDAGDMLSPTVFRDEAMPTAMLKVSRMPEIQPDDLCLSDWAVFSWEID